MGLPEPLPDIPGNRNDDPAGRAHAWLTVSVLIFVAAVSAFALLALRHTRTQAMSAVSAPVPDRDTAVCPLLFTPSDVTVNHRWTLLAGKRPSVSFTCRPSYTAHKPDFAVLCYSPAGAPEWHTAETRIRRDGSFRLTLRDLHRNMPYECFFIAHAKDTMMRSATVAFSTAP